MDNLSRMQLESVKHLSSRKAAEQLGVGKTTINRYRREYGMTNDAGITDSSADGSVTVDAIAETVSEADAVLAARGIDADQYNVTYGFSEWDGPDGTRKQAVRIKAAPKPVSVLTEDRKPDIDELFAIIENDEPVIGGIVGAGTLVVTPADWQIGKVDYHGGSAETLQRIRNSLTALCERIDARSKSYQTIVLAELGDVVENFYNTSSQRETNDLDITSQIRVARRMLLEVIRELAKRCYNLVYVTVPSNHGSVRVGQQAQAATTDNDWGLSISEQIEDVLKENPAAYGHVQVVRPSRLEESVTVTVADADDPEKPYSDTKIGFVHGHQASSPDKLGEWWKGQSHGRRPVGEADILVTGHWHSLRVQHSGDARWLIVAPTSDAGSSWFTSRTGGFSQMGMLSFEVEDGNWRDMVIN